MKRLTIEVAGKTDLIPVSAFLHVLSNALGILKDLDSNITNHKEGSLRWRIESVTQNSPIRITVTAEPKDDSDTQVATGTSEAVILQLVRGISDIERSADTVPRGFTETTLTRAKELMSVVRANNADSVERVSFSSPDIAAINVPVTPTLHLVANVETMIGPAYERWASFEGKLEVINFHGKERQFNIYDVLTNRKIACVVPETLQEQVRNNLLKRVKVFGNAKYNRENKPLSVKVERIKEFKSRDQLPQLRDIQGANITGNMDSVEYVRSLRDE